MRLFTNFLAVALLCLPLSLFAQNFTVNFQGAAGVPDNLPVCGDADKVTMLIATGGTNTALRSGILATAKLFKGMRFVSLDVAGSSAGVVVQNMTNVNAPVFTLPNMGSGGVGQVVLSFNVTASCDIIDTLDLNEEAEVTDMWSLGFTMSGNTMSEAYQTLPYNNAIKVPFFTESIANTANSPTVGDVFTRTIVVNNSGLEGYVGSLNYANTQGGSTSVRAITVNGVNVPFTKSTLATGDTLVKALISGTIFQQNTSGGVLADGDMRFESDETMTLVETLVLSSCSKNRNSTHRFSWGCFNDTCAKFEGYDLVYLGEGSVSVGFSPTGTVAKVNPGYCQEGTSSVVFTNNGVAIDAGTANMYNLEVGIGLGNAFAMADAGYEITSVKINGVSFPNVMAFMNLNNHPLLAEDADGPGRLSDLDADGFFDDLGPGGSVEYTVTYGLDCAVTAIPDSSGFCFNELVVALNAKLAHTNFCGERVTTLKSRYASNTNGNDIYENCADPDVFNNGALFHVQHFERRGIFNFDRNCGGEEQYIVTYILPEGINPVIDSMKFSRFTVAGALLSHTQVGDTLTLVYNGAAFTFLNGDYFVDGWFTADCDAVPGLLVLPVSVTYYCPSCDCKHLWYCDNLIGPYIHYDEAACGVNNAYNCQVGLQTTDFSVERTTFGFQDLAYTTPFNPALANKKVAISCDSVRMKIATVVGQSNLTDSIGFGITYINPDYTDSVKQLFLFDYGSVRFVHNGVSQSCTIDSADLKVVIQDSLKTLYFNANQCMTGLGITLVPGDSVCFTGSFSVNPDGPYGQQFKKVPQFRGFGYYVSQGDTVVCSSFGETFLLAKEKVGFSYPGSSNFPKGCKNTKLDYRLILVNNDFKKYFGLEYRAAVKVDSIAFYFDPNVLDAFDGFYAEVSIPGHPTYGNNFYPMDTFTHSGYYIARFDTLVSVPSYNLVTSNAFNFRITLIPKCESEAGSSAGSNRYNFDPVLYYRDRYFASTIGDGSCVLSKRDSVNNDIFYTDPPILSLTPVTAPIISPQTDTATWTIKLCNTSDKGDAGKTWVSIEDPSSTIEVISMRDITNTAAIQNLAFEPFGTTGARYFAVTDGLKVAAGASTLNDICNYIEVKAAIVACGSADFTASAGWTCVTYDSIWNPEDYPPCVHVSLPLGVNTAEPALAVAYVNQTNDTQPLCDTIELEILIRNTDLGSAFDLNSKFIIPIKGATLVTNGVEVAYPSSGTYQPALGNPIYAGSSIRGDIYEFTDWSLLNSYLDANGLQGFNPLFPNDSNQVKIKLRFTTDCDFRSGSIAYELIKALSACGEGTNTKIAVSKPIDILGSENVVDTFDIAYTPSSFLVAGAVATVGIAVTNLTHTISDGNDEAVLKIPSDIQYVAGSSVGIQPTSWVIAEPTISIADGYAELRWKLPIGLDSGEVATFNFELISPALPCDSATVETTLAVLTSFDAVCITDNSTCTMRALTSIDGEALNLLQVSQNAFSIHIEDITSICASQTAETVTITGSLHNNGDALSGAYQVKYYFDANLNGLLDSADVLVKSVAMNGPVAALGDVSFQHTFNAPISQVCHLLAFVDIGLDAQCILLAQPVPMPRLLNAGNDAIICATNGGSSTSIGSNDCSNTYAYTWTSIPANIIGWVSDIHSPLTQVSIPNAAQQDTVAFVLETTRPGCDNSYDTVRVIRATRPTIALGPDIFLLPGGSTTLSSVVSGGVAPYTYTWTPASTLSNANIKTPTATPTQNTTYQVTVTTASGCTATDAVQVIISVDLTAMVSPTQSTICAGESVTLMASGGTDYLWYADAGNPVGGALNTYSGVDITFVGGNAGSTYIYHVVVTDDAYPGFSDTATATITVALNPVVNVSMAGEINCSQGEVTLTASGAQQYTWYNASNQVLGQGAVQIVAPSEPTTYTVIGATNNCKDTADVTVIPSLDDAPPVIDNVPNNVTITCGDDLPAVSDVFIFDQCDQDLDIDFSETVAIVNGCTTVTTRAWLVTDDNGNTASASYTITQTDDVKPVITFVHPLLVGLEQGDTLYVDCSNPPIFHTDDAVATDNCGQPNLTMIDNGFVLGTCEENGFQVLMNCAWIATDACNNVKVLQIFIAITDTIAPQFSDNVETYFELGIGEEIPEATPPLAFDNCGQPTVTLNEVTDIVYCQTHIQRTWTAADACGNTDELIQDIYLPYSEGLPTITLLHPLLQGLVNNDTIKFQCPQLPPALGLGDVLIAFECDDYPAVIFKESIDDTLDCTVSGYLFMLKCSWEATDGFGNIAKFKIHVQVVDTVPPYFANIPEDITVTDTADIQPVYSIVAFDDCDQQPEVAYDQTEVINGCEKIITRTWVATDDCGSTAVGTQVVTYLIDPFITMTSLLVGLNNNDTIAIQCGDPLPLFTAADVAATNDCLIGATVALDTTFYSTNCQTDGYLELIRYRWTATATNGITATFHTFVEIIDTIPPAFNTFVEPQISISHPDSILPATLISAIDNCGNEVTVTVNESLFGDGDCGSVITRLWTATDQCGNTTTLTQQLLVACDCHQEIMDHESRVLIQFDCTEPQYYCFGIPPDSLSYYTILDNGMPYQGETYVCEEDSLINYSYQLLPGTGFSGPYQLFQWEVNGVNHTGTFSNINQLMDSMSVWDPAGMWTPWYDAYSICGSATGNTSTYGPLVIGQLSTGFSSIIQPSLSTRPISTELGFQSGIHYIKVINNLTGCSDSMFIKVICFEFPELQIGTTVIEGTYDEYCLSSLGFGGEIISIESYCPDFGTDNVNFTIDQQTDCVTYQGLSVGTDTLCLYLCMDYGLCAYVWIVTNVIAQPSVQSRSYSLLESDTMIICLDTIELPGTPVSVTNTWDDTNANNPAAEFHIVNGQICFMVQGMHPGQSSACVVVCDNLGYCDTTIINITVLALVAALPPDAVTDYAETKRNEPIDIPIFSNDDINGTFVSAMLLSGPLDAVVNFDNDLKAFRYTPRANYCDQDKPDVFVYELCNQHGCDTAHVNVYTFCGEVIIYSGFSPNGDGFNDYFVIDGVTLVPENKLSVYNRWGNRVFIQKGYKNTWNGIDETGAELPDGTYFYLFDDGNGNTYSGYIQINR